MNIGKVRKLIGSFINEIQRTQSPFDSSQLSTKFNDLFDDLLDDDLVTPELGKQVKKIIVEFWQAAAQIAVCEDWETNATIQAWLKLKDNLQETKWELQDAHHIYFYHGLSHEYNHVGDHKIPVEKLMPVLVQCCRMIGYSEKKDLTDYPFTQIKHMVHLNKAHLIDSIKAIVTSLAVIFYMLDNHCSTQQRITLLRLITYRNSITEEEIRSETAIINAFCNKPEKALRLLIAMEQYLDGRELLLNDALNQLKGLIPDSRCALIAATTKKPWDYGMIYSLYSDEPEKLIDALTKAMAIRFDTLRDHSYPSILSFARSVIQQSANLPIHAQNKILSALYFFCLGQYVELRKNDATVTPFFSFSKATKCSAAKKIQQKEMGYPTHFSIRELGATNEGRLRTLVDMFEDFKHQQVRVAQLQ